MNSLVELIAKKQKNIFAENLEAKAMNSILGHDNSYLEEMPIEVKKTSEWEYINSREKSFLQKKYKLSSVKHLLFFINESIKEFSNYHHFPEILIVELEVTIKLFTFDINDVTETDNILSKKIDNIFQEISTEL